MQIKLPTRILQGVNSDTTLFHRLFIRSNALYFTRARHKLPISPCEGIAHRISH